MKPSRNEGRRLRVLLIAEQCNPEQTSVPLVSWYYYRELRKLTDVHLITQVRNVGPLGRAGLEEGRDYTAIDSEKVARPLWRLGSLLRGGKGKGWTTVMAFNTPSYYYFEHLLWKRFGDSISRREYDIVHRLTPLSPTIPSLIAKRCASGGVPFILGPMNGGLPWPTQYRSIQAREREWLSSVRSLSRMLPYWRSTFRRASVVISGSRDTWGQLRRIAGDRHMYMPRNGVDVDRFDFSRRPGQLDPTRPLNLLFVGRLVPYKGCDMLLEAVAPLLQAGLVSLSIAGAGPQRDELEALARNLTHQGVQFLGNVPHAELGRHFASSDLFVFPSIREFGGAVVLEALASGVPVMAVDYGGPGELVTSECGMLVPIGSREEIIKTIRSGVERIEKDRESLRRMGECARARAQNCFDWSVKAAQLVAIYDWALGSTPRPDFGPDFLRLS